MNTFDYLFCKARENGKVAKALSEKLQTEVDKNNLVDEIGNIDVGAIVQGIVKTGCLTVKDIVIDTASDISNNKYGGWVFLAAIDYLNATSISDNAMTNCLLLKSINMPVVTSIGGYAMYNCISLKSINMPIVTSIGNSAMYNCISLTSVNMPVATSIGNSVMTNCLSLKSINMPIVTSIGSSAMTNCASLTSLKLGANQVCTLANKNALQNTPIAKGTGYIYVPDDLVDSYKTATNWSVYADQIKPMSEYVEEEE